jgi:hypothetical protein
LDTKLKKVLEMFGKKEWSRERFETWRSIYEIVKTQTKHATSFCFDKSTATSPMNIDSHSHLSIFSHYIPVLKNHLSVSRTDSETKSPFLRLKLSECCWEYQTFE